VHARVETRTEADNPMAVPHLTLPGDAVRLANLCGPLDENLRQIEAALNVALARRGEHFSARGENAAQALLALRYFHERAAAPVSIDDIQLGLLEIGMMRQSELQTRKPDGEAPRLLTRKSDLRGRTPNQIKYLCQIQARDIVFGFGPAGTGKTYLAVASAVDAFERELVERIILTRPAVEAGERLGFLPGDLAQKVDPYLRPLYDALYDLMGFDKVSRLFEKGALEIAPLAFMRGRTLNRAFVILDEAQNTTPEQMKMFLTRIGIGAKAVITGDPSQVDLPRGQQSGLTDALEKLSEVQGIAYVRFGREDVVRHPLVARIVAAYEGAEG